MRFLNVWNSNAIVVEFDYSPGFGLGLAGPAKILSFAVKILYFQNSGRSFSQMVGPVSHSFRRPLPGFQICFCNASSHHSVLYGHSYKANWNSFALIMFLSFVVQKLTKNYLKTTPRNTSEEILRDQVRTIEIMPCYEGDKSNYYMAFD